MTSHVDSSDAERVLNLAALRALANQGHFKAAVANADATITENPTEEILRDCIVAWSHSRLGDQKTAASLAKEAYLRARDELGEDDATTLVALNDYARFSFRAGDAALGLEAGQKVLDKRIELLGPEHPKTLQSRANLIRYNFESGVSVSPTELEELLAAWSRTDPDRKDAAHLSAALLRADIMQDWALKARADVVRWYVQALGEDHPDTLRALKADM